eukprot:3254122-Rhodomonas_salina.1
MISKSSTKVTTINFVSFDPLSAVTKMVSSSTAGISPKSFNAAVSSFHQLCAACLVPDSASSRQSLERSEGTAGR